MVYLKDVAMVMIRMSCLSLVRQWHGFVVHGYSHVEVLFSRARGRGGASLGECMCSLRVSLLLWSGRGVVCVFVKLPCCAC